MQGGSKERAYRKKCVLRVLLADDSPVNRQVVSSGLSQAGHVVICVEDGAQALNSMREECFDAVVMDIDMPVMDGLAASRAIRHLELQRGGRVPIIALLAQAEPLSPESCAEAGLDVYIRKPFDIHVLLQTIETVMEPVREIFNREELLERVGGDEALLVTVIGVFRADAKNMLDAVRDAVAAKDAGNIERAAHKLKGALANLSAANAQQVAKSLEEMGRKGTLDGADSAYTALCHAMTALDSHLRVIAER